MPRAARIGDTLFGDIAVKGSFATSEQVQAAMAAQAEAGGPQKKKLGDIMLAMGILSPHQVKNIHKIVKGSLVPGYELLSEVGRGGMGVVYKARQLSMDRVVALKILSKRLQEDARFTARFLQEAKNVAKLNHENIIGAIDVGEANGVHYFAMEFVDGVSLGRTLRQGKRLSVSQGIDVAIQLARALGHAWAQNVVHRDIKPDNIMLSKTGVSKLCDYGLALAAAGPASDKRSEMAEGTPYYISPEAALGKQDIDIRSDLYSLGATLFHLISGRKPYAGKDDREIMIKHVRAAPPDLQKSLPGSPAALATIIKKLMAKAPKDRYQTPDELLEDLTRLKQGKPLGTRPARRATVARRGLWIPVLLGAGVVLFACLLAWWATSGDPAAEPPPAASDEHPASGAALPGPTPPADSGEVAAELPEPPPVAISQPDLDALEAARAWWKQHPVQLEQARARFAAVAAEFPSTEGARLALLEAEAIDKALVQAQEEELAEFEERAAQLLIDGEFAAADAVYGDAAAQLPDELGARITAGREEVEAFNLRKRQTLLTELADDAAGALEALETLREKSTPAVQRELAKDIASLEGRLAQAAALEAARAALTTLEAEVFAALSTCEFEAAVGRAERWQPCGDAGLDARAAFWTAACAEIASQAKVLRAGLDAQKSQKMTLVLTDGSKESGRLIQYSSDFQLELQKINRREVMRVALGELSQETRDELFGEALRASDWFGRAGLYAACGYAGLVRALEPSAPELEPGRDALLDRLLVESLELEAAAEHERLRALPLDEQLEAAAALARVYPERYAQTRYFAEQRAGVLADLRRVLVAEIVAGGVAGQLHATELNERRDVLELAYDFQSDEQLDDWVLNGEDSKPGAAGVELKGSLSHKLRFREDVEILARCVVRERTKDGGGLVFSLLQGDGPELEPLFSFWNRDGVDIGENGTEPGAHVRGPNHTLLAKWADDSYEALSAVIADHLVLDRAQDLHCAVEGDIVRATLHRNQLYSFRAESLPPTGHAVIWCGKWDVVVVSVVIKGTVDPAWLEEIASQQVAELLAPFE